MVDQMLVEDQVLGMRSAGRSYGAIAKALGFGSAREAYDAFQFAFRCRPVVEQAELRDQELCRLDEFAKRLGDLPDLNEEQLARKLEGVERLRELLLRP